MRYLHYFGQGPYGEHRDLFISKEELGDDSVEQYMLANTTGIHLVGTYELACVKGNARLPKCLYAN